MVQSFKTKNAFTLGSAGTAAAEPTRRPGRPVSKVNFDGREALLNSAHDLLVESHGLPVSMNYICARADINQAMVRYHFGGKRELMVALFERVSSTWIEPLEKLSELDIEPRRKLAIHIKQIIRNFRCHPYFNRLMAELQLTGNEGIQKRLSNSFVNSLLRFYEHVINEGVSTGVFKPVKPLHLFLSIVGLCDYMFSAQPMLDAGLGIRMTDALEAELVEHTTRFVLDGIGVHPS